MLVALKENCELLCKDNKLLDKMILLENFLSVKYCQLSNFQHITK